MWVSKKGLRKIIQEELSFLNKPNHSWVFVEYMEYHPKHAFSDVYTLYRKASLLAKYRCSTSGLVKEQWESVNPDSIKHKQEIERLKKRSK